MREGIEIKVKSWGRRKVERKKRKNKEGREKR